MNLFLNTLLLSAVLPLSSVISAARADDSLDANSSPVTDQSLVLDRFRTFFQGAVDQDTTLDAFNQLIYYPTPELLSGKDGIDPFSLYLAGKQRGQSMSNADARSMLLKTLRATRSEDRPTFVVIPGLFSEFIKNRPFEELFAKTDSSFAQGWITHLGNYKIHHAGDAKTLANTTDERFSLVTNSKTQAPIEEEINAASIDDIDGQPLFRAILLNVKALSLESIGKSADSANAFNSRLGKFFEIWKSETGLSINNLVFIGYSRGAEVALDMMVKANVAPQVSWLDKIKAVATLGGVLYGSDLANQAENTDHINPPPASALQLQALKTLGTGLKPLGVNSSPSEKLVALLGNEKTWKQFNAVIQASTPKTSDSPKKPLPDLSQLAHQLPEMLKQAQTLQSLDYDSILKQLPSLLRKRKFHAADAVQLIAEHDSLVFKIQLATAALTDAVDELSTPTRTKWWTDNLANLPTSGVLYDSIIATMMPQLGGTPPDQVALAKNPYAYNPEMLEYGVLVQDYKQFCTASRNDVNDSQMAAEKAYFQEPDGTLDSHLLGVLGTTHWALALQNVFEVDPKNARDPYPRIALLEALAAEILSEEPTQ